MKPRLLRLGLRLLSGLPLPAIHAIGAALGTLLWWLPSRVRRVTLINLQLCYPSAGARRLRALARASLRETGKALCELAALWFWSPERVERLVRARDGWEDIEAALRAGKGLIVLSPHTGCWELAGLYISRRAPVTLMYRPPRGAAMEPLILDARERAGARLVPTDASGVRALYRALAAGEVVGLLPDQEPRWGVGVFAPLFGVCAYTMVLPARLAQKTGAPAIIATMRRLPRGRGFHLHVLALDRELYEPDPARAAGALNRGVEEIVHLAPEQYMWNYKRFRRQPDGSTRDYRQRGRAPRPKHSA